MTIMQPASAIADTVLVQGFYAYVQPIISYNYGVGNYKRSEKSGAIPCRGNDL